MSIEGRGMKRGWEGGPSEERAAKRQLTELGAMVGRVLKLAEKGEKLPSVMNPELGELFQKITAQADGLNAQDKKALHDAGIAIKGLIEGERGEVRQVVRAINVLDAKLVTSKKRAREEEVEEVPEAKRERPDPFKLLLDNYVKGTASLGAVLEDIFVDPANKELIQEKAAYTLRQMEQVLTEESLFGKVSNKISNFASGFFYNQPSTGDPETLRIFADVLLNNIDSVQNLYTFLRDTCGRLRLAQQAVAENVLDAIVSASSISDQGMIIIPSDEVLSTVYNFPAEVRGNLIERIAPFVERLGDLGSPYLHYLQMIADTPPNRLDEVMTAFDKLDPRTHSHFFLSVPEGIRVDVVLQTAALFEKIKIPNWGYREFIETVSRVVEAGRIDVLEIAKASVSGDINACLISQFLDDITSIPATNLKGMESHVHALGAGNLGNATLLIIRAIAHIPRGQQNDVVHITKSLLRGNERVDQIIALIDVIARIPRGQRKEVIGYARSLFRGNETAWDKTELIGALGDIPRTQRKFRVDLVKSFLRARDGIDDIRSFLEDTAKISRTEMQDVALHARPWITEEMTLQEIAIFLKNIARYPREERKREIAERAQALQAIPGAEVGITELMSCPMPFLNTIIHHSQALAHGLTESEDVLEIFRTTYMISRQAGEQVLAQVVQQALSEIPSGMSVEGIRFFLLRIVEEIVGNRPVVVTDAAYLISTSRNRLEQEPKKLLHDLAVEFTHAPRDRLIVRFSEDVGIDAGGLGRQFVAELVNGIRDKMGFTERENGLYRPELHRDKEGNMLPLTEEDKTTLQELGALFMFCLNASVDYPTGMLFDQSLFEALTKLEGRNLTSIEDLLTLYTAMNYREGDEKYIENLKAYLTPLSPDTPEKVLRDAYALVDGVDAIAKFEINYDLGKIREQYQTIQQAIVGEIIRPVLEPALEIASGMKKAPFQDKVSWEGIQKMSPRELSEKLQGVVTREMIIDKLQYADGYPEEKQAWLENWINHADDAKIRQFLFALTGASSLGRKPLSIEKSRDNIHFHTCYNTVDIPIDGIDSEEFFNTLLDATIAGKEYSRA